MQPQQRFGGGFAPPGQAQFAPQAPAQPQFGQPQAQPQQFAPAPQPGFGAPRLFQQPQAQPQAQQQFQPQQQQFPPQFQPPQQQQFQPPQQGFAPARPPAAAAFSQPQPFVPRPAQPAFQQPAFQPQPQPQQPQQPFLQPAAAGRPPFAPAPQALVAPAPVGGPARGFPFPPAPVAAAAARPPFGGAAALAPPFAPAGVLQPATMPQVAMRGPGPSLPAPAAAVAPSVQPFATGARPALMPGMAVAAGPGMRPAQSVVAAAPPQAPPPQQQMAMTGGPGRAGAPAFAAPQTGLGPAAFGAPAFGAPPISAGPFSGAGGGVPPPAASALQQQAQIQMQMQAQQQAQAQLQQQQLQQAQQQQQMAPSGNGGGMIGPGSLAPHVSGANGGAVAMAHLDERGQCLPAYMSLTVGAFPKDPATLQRTSLPFGVLVQPMAEGEGSLGPGRVPLVNFVGGSAPASTSAAAAAAAATAAGGAVVRCKKCRAYINPFAKFLDSGRRWKCNFCAFVNDVPAAYFSPTDAEGNRQDLALRPELTQGSVEFVAPAEYMVRPPQPPVYVFVIDVSFHALQCGMLACAVEAVRASLDRLQGDGRTLVGFVSFDTAVHFYNLRSKLRAPQMLVVPDIADLFMPVPEELLVNLAESRAQVDQLLAALPAMFAGTKAMETCLGPALDAAFQVCQHVGGKMVVCVACLPTVGAGRLQPRELPKMLGGDFEHKLLAPDANDFEAAFYKNKAVDFSRQQICVDMFLFSQTYADVATLGALSRYTAGQVYHYPAFNQGPPATQGGAPGGGNAQDRARFVTDLVRDLTRPTGFEAVVRLRCSKGVNISNFYGNFFIRSNDLLALPNVTCDTAFAVELVHEEALQPGGVVCVQAALLYTSAGGERRILVHTLCRPVAASVADVFAGIDVDSLVTMQAKMALDVALREGLALSRSYLHKSVVDIVRAWRACQQQQVGGMAYGMQARGAGGANVPGGMGSRAPLPPGSLGGAGAPGVGGGGAGGAGGPGSSLPGHDMSTMLPENLQLLPLFSMALAKSTLHRGGEHVRSDERASLVYRMLTLPVREARAFLYPRLFSLHDMEAEAGRPEAPPAPGAPPPSFVDPLTGALVPRVALPPTGARGADGGLVPYPLSASALLPQGCYLLDDGVEIFLWVGREAPPGLVSALFGVPSLQGSDAAQLQLADLGNDYSSRVCAVVRTLRAGARQEQRLRVVREGAGDVNEARFHWRMIEDRQGYRGGEVTYAEYASNVWRESQMMQVGGAH